MSRCVSVFEAIVKKTDRIVYRQDDDAEYDLSEELPPVSILDPKSSSTDPPSQVSFVNKYDQIQL